MQGKMQLNSVQNAEKCKAISINIRYKEIDYTLSNHVFAGSKGQNSL